MARCLPGGSVEAAGAPRTLAHARPRKVPVAGRAPHRVRLLGAQDLAVPALGHLPAPLHGQAHPQPDDILLHPGALECISHFRELAGGWSVRAQFAVVNETQIAYRLSRRLRLHEFVMGIHRSRSAVLAAFVRRVEAEGEQRSGSVAHRHAARGLTGVHHTQNLCGETCVAFQRKNNPLYPP